MPGGTAVVTRSLRRTYTTSRGTLKTERSEREALKSLNLEVEHGELFGLPGPNGAGNYAYQGALDRAAANFQQCPHTRLRRRPRD